MTAFFYCVTALGIGFETSVDFAKRGARVILACRDGKKAEEARDKIIKETGNADIKVKILDLASFRSVRNFADDIIAEENTLDILVNNAGIGGTCDEKSVDNNCLIMQTNYFSIFLLTNLLMNLLKKSGSSRIINVSSVGASFAKFDIKNINTFTGPFNTYNCSKLCINLFTIQLANKLTESKVTIYSVHPGIVNTEIFRNAQGIIKVMTDLIRNKFFRVSGYIFVTFFHLFFQTSKEGAQTTIYAALTEEIKHLSGEHFDNCRKVPQYHKTKDPVLAKRVWNISAKIVGLEEILN